MISEVKINQRNRTLISRCYQYSIRMGLTNISSLAEFMKYQSKLNALEKRAVFLMEEDERTVGQIILKQLYTLPTPVHLISIKVNKQHFSISLKEETGNWIRQRKEELTGHLITYESDPDLLTFYQAIGGRQANWLNFYELLLASMDQKLLDEWDDNALLSEHHLALKFYEKIPDSLLGDHANIHTELSNDILRKDDSWSVEKTADYTRKREMLLALEQKKAVIAYLVDRQEKIVGLSKVVFDPASPERIYQTITGVTENYRCKGLTKLLKAKMIKHIKDRFPGVKVIETDCLEGNDPMISINRKLGFCRKNVPTEVEIIL